MFTARREIFIISFDFCKNGVEFFGLSTPRTSQFILSTVLKGMALEELKKQAIFKKSSLLEWQETH